jgi:hypothetical protein
MEECLAPTTVSTNYGVFRASPDDHRPGWHARRVRCPEYKGADLNQVQTDTARLVGHRNPATSRAIHNLRNGSRSERVGDYTLTVVDRSY